MSDDFLNEMVTQIAVDFEIDPATGKYYARVWHKGQLIRVAWCPINTSQDAFLKMPETEGLFGGTRGNGKSYCLLGDFARDVGKGYGAHWRGVLFRRSMPMHKELIELSYDLFLAVDPNAKFNQMKSMWEFSTGETLHFAHMDTEADEPNYRGHSYSWIGWDELTSWDNPVAYDKMFATLRAGMPGIAARVRATTNPYDIGQSWVKRRFRLPLQPGQLIGPAILDAVDSEGRPEPSRRYIHGHFGQNHLLTLNNPQYIERLRQSASGSKALEAAWLGGSWLGVGGNILDEIWIDYQSHFLVPKFQIPHTWRIYRCMDWGSSKPFCILYFAVSDGCDLVLPNGKVRSTIPGDKFMVGEIYGWNGRPDEGLKLLPTEVARRIKSYEIARGWPRVRIGPADTMIFAGRDGAPSIAHDMESAGVTWVEDNSLKKPGSRVQGWNQLRKCLSATAPDATGFREVAGLFIVAEMCPNVCRTFPELPRSKKDMDDVDGEATEDHAGDCCRYSLLWDGIGSRVSFSRRTT